MQEPQKREGFDRRQILRATAVTGAVLGAGGVGAVLGGGSATASETAAGAAAADCSGPAGLPRFEYLKTLLRPEDLDYNPTGEIIFPCVRGVYDKLSNPLGRYYLYYGPHDAPGGICLAYGDSLEGPFTEYPGNPIIDNRFAHLEVSHVASPHVMWVPESREFFLYFHGENTVTRLARSKDGVNFTYDKAVLSTRLQPSGTTETSYARVFPHNLPSHDDARYVMVFMGNNTTNRRYIGWGWSKDARNWTFDQKPLVHPSEVGSRDIAAPCVLEHGGSTYVIYHQNREAGGNMLVTEVGKDFSKRDHLGVFHSAMQGAPDNGRCAAPSFGTMGGVPYMIYEAGARLEGSIAVAKAVPGTMTRPSR